MPARLSGNLPGAGLLRWLARGRVEAAHPGEDMAGAALRAVGCAGSGRGWAALRWWGQTGARPAGFVAAADPVHLEARLDHLCLHALDADGLAADELAALFADLQSRLGADGAYEFVAIGHSGYLCSPAELATAAASPQAVAGRRPDAYLPCGAGAAAHDRLQSEVQMLLHEHALNRARAAAGRPVVNSLWFWGGGPPEVPPQALPTLFAAEPLLRGYWHAAGGEVRDFAGSLEDCQAAGPGGRVVVELPEVVRAPAAALEEALDQVRFLLRRRAMGGVTLLFRDGITVALEPGDAWRVWRRVPDLFREAAGDV